MRRFLFGICAVVLLLPSVGCILNRYSSDPNKRMQTLLNDSEGLRQIHDEVDRFWFNDQPSHLTYIKVHGGIGP